MVEPYRSSGSLYAEDTTAAIVVGHRIGFDCFALLPERVEALEQALMAALRARGLELTLYVAGDTTTSPDDEIPAQFVLGEAVATTEANDWEPSPVDPTEIKRQLSDFPPLGAAFWREALAGFEGAEVGEAPSAYILSWGPLQARPRPTRAQGHRQPEHGAGVVHRGHRRRVDRERRVQRHHRARALPRQGSRQGCPAHRGGLLADLSV